MGFHAYSSPYDWSRIAGFKATAKTVSYQVDIARAYPQEANVKSWIRNYTLHRKKDFTITDKCITIIKR